MIRSLLFSIVLTTPAGALDLSRVKDVVILGETHDNGLHHQGQADLIRKVQPKAVVFEMLSAEQAARLNADPQADAAGLEELLDWSNSGWPDFALYQPVFEASDGVPVVGAAAPKGDVRRAFGEGAAAVFGDAAPRFGLDIPVPGEELAARKQMQFEAHCAAMPLDMMGGMVEAQRYRDAAFAAATLEALDTYGAPVVLIAGNGHARLDWGVPAMIALAAPGVNTLSVGFVEEPSETDDPRFDHTIVTAAADRDDPCAALQN